MLAGLLAWTFGLLAAAGIGYMLHATLLVLRLGRRPVSIGPAEAVTLLKPLHGPEPRLRENLASFLDQDWDAPIEMVAGVADPADPAAAVARALGATVLVDPARHGGNAKVSNLINMAPAASHGLVVLSDSDMAAPRDYLGRLAAALAEPGVGAVTCAYRGRGDAGRWSDLAAAGISYHFLPQLLVGLAVGMARPGMGSTIALRRATLDAVGGFTPFADSLADDYELGEAVRALGFAVAVPPMLLVHGCTERSLAEVWRHERRWAATILRINPGGQIGTIVTYPLPMALACLAMSPWPGTLLLAAAFAARLLLWRSIDRVTGARSAPAWMLLPRDLLSFAVFVTSFVARSVDWRGQRLTMTGRGRIAARSEFVP